MRALVAARPGRPVDVLKLRDVPDPLPGPGEVAVRMLASTIHPSDVVTISGAYASRTTYPFVPGFEGVGVIARVGDGVPDALLGRRVLPVGTAGDWQQVKVTDASWCVPVPDDVDDDTAGFAYVNPLTAWLMVDRFCGPAVRTVLVTAATSTIGGHLAELLAARGTTPIGLTRGPTGREVRDPGAWRAVVGTADPGWAARVRAGAPGGVDVVLDAVGGPLGLELQALLADGGALVHYGLLSGVPLPAACFDGRRGTRVVLFRLRDVVHAAARADLPALFGPVFDHLRAGRLRSDVARTVPLTEFLGALRDPSTHGKIRVLVQD